MLSPEKSFADIEVIQELFRRKLIDKDIIADALMTDFTVSTFSKVRCDLAATVPDHWTTVSELRSAWIAKLDGSDLRGAAGLTARLEDTSDLTAHEQTLDRFVEACNARNSTNPDDYAVDLLKVISQRRVEFIERHKAVVGSEWFLPGDALESKAHAIRLNGATCELEDQAAPLIGE